MDFSTLNLEELRSLNKQVCDAINKKLTAEASVKITQFAVGDRVRYAGSAKCAPFEATVQKVLRVNVDVITAQGRPWRIHAASLTKIN
jgi:hypothetical protein